MDCLGHDIDTGHRKRLLNTDNCKPLNALNKIAVQQSITPAEQLKDLQKEIDDVQVQIHRCPDVLVQIILLDQHPGVKNDVAAEEQCPEQCKDGAAVTSQASVSRNATHAEAWNTD